MRSDIRSLLDRQAAWQCSRKAKPWGDKLRSSIAMRSALQSMRKSGPLRHRSSPSRV
jgi:hypothetical protein